jgi:hypothetical protein
MIAENGDRVATSRAARRRSGEALLRLAVFRRA